MNDINHTRLRMEYRQDGKVKRSWDYLKIETWKLQDLWDRELTWMGECKLALKTMGERYFLYRIGGDYRILLRGPSLCPWEMVIRFANLTTNDLATDYFKYVSVYKRK